MKPVIGIEGIGRIICKDGCSLRKKKTLSVYWMLDV
jgi:hypothetical protein